MNLKTGEITSEEAQICAVLAIILQNQRATGKSIVPVPECRLIPGLPSRHQPAGNSSNKGALMEQNLNAYTKFNI